MKLLFSSLIIVLNINIFAQFTEFHPELDWYTIKGKYVEVHFHDGAERTAQVVLKIADEVWEPICSLYGYQPDKVHYIIKDIDDYSNGATYFFDNKIEIWTSALDFDLRGTHNWLRNVISHEFTHMVQIQSAMKTTRSIPAVFLQVLSYEDKRRPDILYGFPNFVLSYPLATVNVPAWFAEGTAQYMRTEFNYDNWDSHRDMILRSYALEGKMLTWNEMGVFGKTSLGNESVYNSGFALTRYIAQKYGEDKLGDITKLLGSFGNFTIDAAMKKIIGVDGDELYDEWSKFLKEDYRRRSEKVLSDLITGEEIGKEGFGNFYPVFSNNGKKIYYISNKSSDYFAPAGIYEYDIQTKEEKNITVNVRSTFSFIPNQNKILYAKITDDNKNWYNVHDLFIYDLDTKKEKRLTYNLRANNPAVSNDGKSIVFIYQKDGTTNLGSVNIDGSNFKRLTFYENGEQVYNPKFSPDDSFIIFDYSYGNTRDIAKVAESGGNVEFLIATDKDERNPVFDKDGNMIYASDKTGIFNLYRYSFSDGLSEQLTNVIGGAFMPAINNSNDIVYAGYTSSGYKIFRITSDEQKKVNENNNYFQTSNPPLNTNKSFGDINNFNITSLINYEDKNIDWKEKETYRGAFSRMTFFPFLRFDNYNTGNTFMEKIKPGVFVTTDDMLNRYSLFAGGSINSRMERDLFLVFDFKNKLPLVSLLGLRPELSLELYSISRKTNVDVMFGADTIGNVVNYDFIIPTDVTYNLFEIDFIINHRLFSRNQNLQLKYVYSSYTATLGSFFLPDADNTLYPTTKDNYFNGHNLETKFTWREILPTKDDEINPVGMDINFTYNYEFNDFNDKGEYTVEDGILKPLYSNFNFHRVELKTGFFLPVYDSHTLNTTLRLGSILGPEKPDFFDFYLGGLVGMKAYPFYAISGNEIAWLNITYRFPLFRNIDTKIGHLYLDKIFFSIGADIGNAWNGDIPGLDQFKKGIGAELRIQLNSYYLFPTSIFFNASYGFDEFTRVVNNESIKYGKEWNFYGGVLFGFEILNFNQSQHRR
ncbi:MAG: biopolymer transporter Tol [Ignavibacterium sp.]|jgi:Tol biopolymer transport system component|nr:biopolymer transporter Tol [Ignavibacterium sp.]